MASRLSAIRTAIETKVDLAFGVGTVTFSDTPVSFQQIPADQFPFCVAIFEEEPPERLAFKQERRRVVGRLVIAIRIASGATVAATREIMDAGIETVRNSIYTDELLANTVDNASVSGGVAYSSNEDPLVYGTIDVETEELF